MLILFLILGHIHSHVSNVHTDLHSYQWFKDAHFSTFSITVIICHLFVLAVTLIDVR